MMAVLGLEEGFTLDELKARYKLLAKRNHPDLNGGDKEAGERLRLIIEAYTYLRSERLYA
jgi:curved DNA-binding protein CbpA